MQEIRSIPLDLFWWVVDFDAASRDFSIEEVESRAQRQGRLAAFHVFLVGGTAKSRQ
jgi:hypothetical protein